MATKVWGSGGDAGQTAAGTYTFTVPAGVTSVVLTAWAAGGTYSNDGADAYWKLADNSIILQAGGGKNGGNGGVGAGGAPVTGSGYSGGKGYGTNQSTGGGGGAGPTGAGGDSASGIGGTAGTGGGAGAGGNGYIKNGGTGSPATAAGGGAGSSLITGKGGGGGACVRGTFTVTSGQVLTLIVPPSTTDSGNDWAGAMGRAQADYTVDLNAAESGSLAVTSGVDGGLYDSMAQGPPPLLWAPWPGLDTFTTSDPGALAVGVTITSTDTWGIVFSETATLAVGTTLSEADSVLVAFTAQLDAGSTVGSSDGYGPGFAESGSLSAGSVLSGTDTLGFGWAESGTLAVASVLSGSDVRILPIVESGSLGGASVVSGSDGLVVGLLEVQRPFGADLDLSGGVADLDIVSASAILVRSDCVVELDLASDSAELELAVPRPA